MADVKYRMEIAQAVFNSLYHLWKDKRLPMSMKIRLYIASVCSTFTHGCEAWTLSDTVLRKVNGFNSRLARRKLQGYCCSPYCKPQTINLPSPHAIPGTSAPNASRQTRQKNTISIRQWRPTLPRGLVIHGLS